MPLWNMKNPDKKVVPHDIIPMYSPQPNDVIIPVMGYSGAGKSTFINALFNVPGFLETSCDSGDLNRCTQDLTGYIWDYPTYKNKRIVIVDTISADPDDLLMDDAVAVQRVYDWLEFSYPSDVKFAGVIYLHSITDGRVNQDLKNMFCMVNRLCTHKSRTSPVLATTRWGEVADVTIGDSRESQLKGIYWKDMIEGGSTVCRFDNTHQSAVKIINTILTKLEWTTLKPSIITLRDQIQDTEAGIIVKCVLEQYLKLINDAGITERQLQDALKKIEESNPSVSKRLRKLFIHLRTLMSRDAYRNCMSNDEQLPEERHQDDNQEGTSVSVHSHSQTSGRVVQFYPRDSHSLSVINVGDEPDNGDAGDHRGITQSTSGSEEGLTLGTSTTGKSENGTTATSIEIGAIPADLPLDKINPAYTISEQIDISVKNIYTNKQNLVVWRRAKDNECLLLRRAIREPAVVLEEGTLPDLPTSIRIPNTVPRI